MSEYDKEELAKFRRAGLILRETREEMSSFVREEMPIIEVCEKAENLIREKGGKPAFPCNVSINEVAAHYTSPPNDSRRIPAKSIVKVDIGAHVDGYVADTAVTVCFDPEYESLVKAAEAALGKAVESIGPGMSTSKLGTIIESTIKSYGYRPISNLTGHQVGRYLVHAGTSLPNVPQLFSSKIKLGQVYAIEPFVTLHNAAGKVEDGEETTIFRLVRSKSQKDAYAKQLLKYIWLRGAVPEDKQKQAFRELFSSRALMGYYVFVEASRKPVAQAEHTVLIQKDGCAVLT
jgi:methionyl aminopeptidase